jgi:hypothetical protein
VPCAVNYFLVSGIVPKPIAFTVMVFTETVAVPNTPPPVSVKVSILPV